MEEIKIMDKRNRVILCIMLISVILAMNFNVIKTHYIKQEMARDIFIKANVPVSDYMKGIDFSKTVKMYYIQKGLVLIQYQIPGAPQGDFYGWPDSTPDDLGVSEMGPDNICKEMRIYVAVKGFHGLLSHAASVIDNWSTPENEERSGGDLQIFTTCKDCFERHYE